MSRPAKQNPIDFPTWQRLTDRFREVAQNPADRVSIPTGAGDAFSGGGDLSSDGEDLRHPVDLSRYFGFTGLALHDPKPTIARVHGVAVGAGINRGSARSDRRRR